jgi:hypothetical protein
VFAVTVLGTGVRVALPDCSPRESLCWYQHPCSSLVTLRTLSPCTFMDTVCHVPHLQTAFDIGAAIVSIFAPCSCAHKAARLIEQSMVPWTCHVRPQLSVCLYSNVVPHCAVTPRAPTTQSPFVAFPRMTSGSWQYRFRVAREAGVRNTPIHKLLSFYCSFVRCVRAHNWLPRRASSSFFQEKPRAILVCVL